MYLKSIRIVNFRKIKEAECFFNSGLNLIVGPNDSGKTAIIDAIRFVLRQVVDDYARISEDDFNEKKQEMAIDIVFSFDDCDKEKLKQEPACFAEYLSFIEKNKPELRIWYSVKNSEQDIKFPEFKVGPTKDVAVDMDARCREKLKVVYLRPLRDAENELKAKQGSRISKILRNHNDIITAEEELIELLRKFKVGTEDFFNTGKGKHIKDEVDRLLKIFDEQANLQNKNIKFGPTEKLDSCLKTLEKLALYYDDLPRPGLGTLNMIFIAAELLHLNTQKATKLILVEEIEAHLHPQRQLKIIKALQEESKKGIQMILTTHSPNLASVIEVERLNICYDGQFYSLAKGKTELDYKNYSYLGRFLDVTKANLFFTQGVILVEGTTEQLLIPEFAKFLGYNLTDYGISIISTNNLGFEHFVNIFKRKEAPYNQIPIAVITDADKRQKAAIDTYVTEIKDNNNRVGCFVGEQLYCDNDLVSDDKKKTTFEKIIFKNVAKLKELYVQAYNSLKSRTENATVEMDIEQLYEKMNSEKAPIAQEVAQRLSEISDSGEKSAIKKEIEDNLKNIKDAIEFVIPKQVTVEGDNTSASTVE
ncbi:MAG: AAA family ATPase [Candidatus Omnitrophica bacterium]|nr:AAA family ATPase [Candidatus Omnitrophota bacterium]